MADVITFIQKVMVVSFFLEILSYNLFQCES
jgi:hypothetical protein